MLINWYLCLADLVDTKVMGVVIWLKYSMVDLILQPIMEKHKYGSIFCEIIQISAKFRRHSGANRLYVRIEAPTK